MKSLLPLFVASFLLLQPGYAQSSASSDQNLRAQTSDEALAKAPPHTQWKTLGTLPVWVQDMSFVSDRVGYAAGGNGQIWKTTDGANTWLPVLNLDSPYVWNGVHALNRNDVVISGYLNFPEGPAAVIRWSHDGGASWSDDVVLGNSLGNRVYFWNASTGFVTGFAGDPNIGFRTTTGGLSATDWNTITIDPGGGWSGPQFSALANGHVRISGISYCESLNFARTWTCEPSIDPGTDYATFFIDDKKGWVGGGGGIGVPEGSPPLFEGWVHRTTNGGKKWSDRVLDGPWPIRSIIFVDDHRGWAAGGGGDFGGIYGSHDGGKTWAVELDAGMGPQTCTTADSHIFCAGVDNNATSHVYSREFDD